MGHFRYLSSIYVINCPTDWWQEAATGRIVLDEDNASAVERMLWYLYTLDYNDGSSSSPIGHVSDFEDHNTEEVKEDTRGPALNADSFDTESERAESSEQLPNQSTSSLKFYSLINF
jgi:hypothetical protein